MTAPSTAAAETRQIRGVSAVIAVGGLLVTLGSLLPWASMTSAFGAVTKSGVEGGGDGTITLIAGVVLVLAGGADLIGYDLSPPLRPGVLLAAFTAAGLGVVSVLDMAGRVRAAEEAGGPFVTANVGTGLIVVVIGGLLALGGAVALLRRPAVAAARPPVRRLPGRSNPL